VEQVCKIDLIEDCKAKRLKFSKSDSLYDFTIIVFRDSGKGFGKRLVSCSPGHFAQVAHLLLKIHASCT